MLCPYCRDPLQKDARECAACGAWVAKREPLGAWDILFLTLVAIELVGLGALTFLWIPQLRAMYAEFGSTASRAAFPSLVLKEWWGRGCMLFVGGLAALAVALPMRSRARASVFGAALVVGVAAGVLTWWGMMQPIYQLAGSIKAE
jgi:hypothetical protein